MSLQIITCYIKEIKMSKSVLPISLSDLVDAYDENPSDDGIEQALNIKTGVIEFVSEDDYTGHEIHPDIVKDNPDYIIIPHPSSRSAYQEMEAFIQTKVGDKVLRKSLEKAIEGKGAFRHFKTVLLDYPNAREAWFAFKKEQQTKIVQAWLDDNNLTTSS